MKLTLSEILQEQAGTLERNRAIKWRWEHDSNKRGIQTEMARQYGISRQAICDICHNPNVLSAYHQTHHLRFLAFYFKKLMRTIQRQLEGILG